MAVDMTQTNGMPSTGDPDIEVLERSTRRRFSAGYKMRILAEYDTLSRDERGALLRREGLYTSLISEWRKQRDKGAEDALTPRPGRPPLDPISRENARLREKVEHLEKDLARARTVIEVQGKVSALLDGLATSSAMGSERSRGSTGRSRSLCPMSGSRAPVRRLGARALATTARTAPRRLSVRRGPKRRSHERSHPSNAKTSLMSSTTQTTSTRRRQPSMPGFLIRAPTTARSRPCTASCARTAK